MFEDRRHAGRLLAARMTGLAADHPVVIGLPRGGLPVAAEVAEALDAPLDVLVVGRLKHPRQPELGLGAIAEGGFRVVDEQLASRLGVSLPVLDRLTLQEVRKLRRRVQRYRHGTPPQAVEGRTAIVVDDGVATGFTARAGIGALRAWGADRVILAVPVVPPEVAPDLQRITDELICLDEPQWFFSIGEFYEDFAPVSDDEVVAVLDDAAHRLVAKARSLPAKATQLGEVTCEPAI